MKGEPDLKKIRIILTSVIVILFTVINCIPQLGIKLPAEWAFSAIITALIALTLNINEYNKKLDNVEKMVETESVDKVIKEFGQFDDEIRKTIKGADELWMLTRTCIGWFDNYDEEFESLFKNARHIKFLLLDPADDGGLYHAYKTTPDWTFNIPETSKYDSYKELYLEKLRYISGKNNKQKKVELKVTNFLSAWTLIIANPSSHKNKNRRVIYVELKDSGLCSDTFNKPTLRVPAQDGKVWDFLIDEFNSLWKKADVWPKIKATSPGMNNVAIDSESAAAAEENLINNSASVPE